MIALLLLVLGSDSASTQFSQRRIPVAPRETLTVTIDVSGVAAGPDSAAQRVPVVLIPGLIGASFGYRRVMPMIAAAGHPTYVIEPLGVGTSSHGPDSDYGLDAQADRVGAVLDSLGVRRAIVAGANFGASVAMRLAYRRQECVAAVLLLDGGPVDRSYTDGVSTAMKLAPLLRLFGARGVVKGKVRKALTDAAADPAWVTPEVADAYAAPIIADLGSAIHVMQAMQRAPVREALRDNLWRITQPVRLLIGSSNRRGGIGADETALLAERLPEFRADSVMSSGAYLHEERPDAVVAAVLALADSARAGAKSTLLTQTSP